MAETENKQDQNNGSSSFTGTTAFVALLLAVFNTIFILQNLPTTPGPAPSESSDFVVMEETISQLQADLQDIRNNMGKVDYSLEELQLRQSIPVLERILTMDTSDPLSREEAEKAKKHVERLLMRLQGLEPPVESTVSVNEATDKVQEAMENIGEQGSEMADDAAEAVSDPLNEVMEAAAALGDDAVEAGEDALEAASDAADEAAEAASETVDAVEKGVETTVKDLQESSSAPETGKSDEEAAEPVEEEAVEESPAEASSEDASAEADNGDSAE